MEIVERRKPDKFKDKIFLLGGMDAPLAPSISLWRTWTTCLVLACVCTVTTVIWGQWLDGPVAKMKVNVDLHQLANLPAMSSEEDPVLGISKPDTQRLIYVQDAVVFPDNVMLLVEVPDSVDLEGNMDSLQCRFGGMRNQSTTPVISIKPRTKDLQMVRCSMPGWLKEFPSKSHKNVTLEIRNSDIRVESTASYNPHRLPTWDYVVYENLLDTDSIILLVKGLVTKSSKRIDINSVKCIFGKKLTSKNVYETRVITAAQEIVRCEKPAPHLEEKLRGYHLSVSANWLGVVPSVTYYNPDNRPDHFMESFKITAEAKPSKKEFFDNESTPPTSTASANYINNQDENLSSQPTESESRDFTTRNPQITRKRKLCACTMVWNKAQFIKEWVTYHSFFGVERYFLYDNDSDDSIEQVLHSLSAHNISRMIWPWIKTQQAAFSHCTILAREECEWVMFVDVDEYIYPQYYLAATNRTSSSDANVLHRVIKHESEKWVNNAAGVLGEIQFDCNNFGPSGLDHSPEKGVTVGYTCRLRNPERHKSIVFLDAVNNSLLNVLHHFELLTGYHSTKLVRSVGVVNHYKFQAWDVFKMKFVRRAGPYTTDWQKAENKGSKDRTPGLGTEAVKPDDWEQRFCEVQDTRLRDFVLQSFKKPDEPEKLQWEDL